MNEAPISLEIRLLTLLHRAREEHDAAARAELNALLREDAQARAMLPRLLVDEQALVSELRDESIVALMEPRAAAGAGVGARRFAWLSWRPLAAAAAGVVFGLFCAAVAWAYTGPRAAELIERVLPLANGDFESAEQPAADGMPSRFGVWSGDFASVVGAEQGVEPKHGQRMLRVLRSDSRLTPPGEDTRVGDMMQLVDLRPFKAEVASGNAVIELTASANMVAAKPGEKFTFRAVILAFSGRPEEMGDYLKVWQTALACAASPLNLDDDPGTWQTTTVRMLLPANTDFVMIKVPMDQEKPSTSGHIEFAGHYVDDLRLVLNLQPAKRVRISQR